MEHFEIAKMYPELLELLLLRLLFLLLPPFAKAESSAAAALAAAAPAAHAANAGAPTQTRRNDVAARGQENLPGQRYSN